MQKFEKKERASKKSIINSLFREGKFFEEGPFRIIWKLAKSPSQKSTQTIMIVPKKHVSKAYLRNKVKRFMREAYRKNKKDGPNRRDFYKGKLSTTKR